MSSDTIFAQAIEIASDPDRAVFLDEACGNDSELRRELEKLIRDHFRAGAFLERPAAHLVGTVDEPISERPGTVIGPYKLMEQIGEGGFGLVFVAEQQQPVRRKVALKVIKPGMDTREVIARFEAERQALALMDHPNIARVFDAGATDSGRPYFVMELVKGVPITQFCDDGRLTPRERLELFVSVCQAVQHAHQKGIIHRDVKPSNVLVTSHDGTPVVKVIDFGVAKAVGPQLTEKTIYTGFTQMLGTPLYMSPEQAGMSGLDIDTRTDIYALGVLLYELLTGTTPFDSEKLLTAGYDEMRRIIREEEPLKPSSRISTRGQAAATASDNRQSDPKKLSQLLRGELDWIVMKALEKDRNRRYETANDFARDVRRYLADEPVLACPPSAGYRLRKFVRRNRGPVVAASVILLCLVVGIIGTTAGLVWAVRERDDKAKALIAETKEREAKERALADETRAREAEKQARDKAMAALRAMLNEFVQDQMARDTQLTDENREFLCTIIKHYEGFAAVTADDAESRAIRAEGYFGVGLMRSRLGELKEAEEAYGDALALYKQLAADYPTRPFLRQNLAITHNNLGSLLQITGRLREAEEAYGEALVLYKQLATEILTRPEFRQDLARCHYSLGTLFSATGRLKEAETAHGEALALHKQLVADFPKRPKFRQELAVSHGVLGNLLRTTGRLKEAEAAYGDALALSKQLAADFRTRPEFRQDLARSHNNLGNLLHDTGRLQEAETAYADALALRKQLAADFPIRPEFRQDLAASHNNLGLLLSAMSRLKEAETAYQDALAIRKQLAADFPTRPEFGQELAASQHNLGALLRATGRLKEAEAAYADALALRKQLAADFRTRPEFRQDLAHSHNSLGALLHATGRPKGAETAYGDALALQKQLAADFPNRPEFRRELAQSHNNLGNLLRVTGRPKTAETAFGDALALSKQLVAEFPIRADFRQDLAAIQNNLGNLLRETGRPKEAETAYGDALVRRKQLAADFPDRPDFRRDLANSYHTLGNQLRAAGRPKEAETTYTDALALQKQLVADFPNRPEFRQDLARSHYSLGALLRATGRPKEAEIAYADALALQKQLVADFPNRPEFRRELAVSHNSLGNLLSAMGRPKEAEAAYADALALQKQLAAQFPNQPDLRNEVAVMCVNVALFRLGQRDFKAAIAYLDEARPHHEAALKANPRHPDYRQCYQNNLTGLIRANAGLGNQAGAKQAAEKLRGLGGNSPVSAYDAARFLSLCIPIVQGDDQATKEERDRQAQFYGDEAMKMLRDAVAKGYKDAAHMKTDTGLAPLRERDDFKKLLAELNAK